MLAVMTMTTTMRPCFFLTCGDWVISLDVPFHLQEMLVEISLGPSLCFNVT